MQCIMHKNSKIKFVFNSIGLLLEYCHFTHFSDSLFQQIIELVQNLKYSHFIGHKWKKIVLNQFNGLLKQTWRRYSKNIVH